MNDSQRSLDLGNWQLVRAGLRMILVALLLGSIALIFIWSSFNTGAYREVAYLLTAMAVLTASGLMLGGYALLAASPFSGGHRVFGWIAAAAMLLTIVIIFNDWPDLTERHRAMWPTAAGAAHGLAVLFTLLYLFPLAAAWGRRELSRHAIGVLLCLVLLVGTLFTAALVPDSDFSSEPPIRDDVGATVGAESIEPPGTAYVFDVGSYDAAQIERSIRQLEARDDDEEAPRLLRQLRSEREIALVRFEQTRELRIDLTREVLTERLNATGLGSLRVFVTNEGRVGVWMPQGYQWSDEIERVVTASGRLHFRMEVDTTQFGREDYRESLQYPENPDPLRYRWFRFAPSANTSAAWHTDEDGNAWILIEFDPHGDYPVAEGEHLARVYPTQRDPSNPGDRYPLGFEFEERQQGRFAELTRRFSVQNYEDSQDAPRLCIIFNERVYWAGTIYSEIVGAGTMSGFGSANERTFMINLIRAGSLPVTLTHVETRHTAEAPRDTAPPTEEEAPAEEETEAAQERADDGGVPDWLMPVLELMIVALPWIAFVWYLVLLGMAANSIRLPGEAPLAKPVAPEATPEAAPEVTPDEPTTDVVDSHEEAPTRPISDE